MSDKKHSHTHSPQEKKAILNRLSRASGHLQSVMGMIERDQDCSEVLMQLAAVRSALTNAGKIILQEHISHCIVDAVHHQDMERIDELNKAIDQFIK